MKRMRRAALALVLVLVMGVLSGCGGMSKDDAKSYVKSVLDANYKAEFKDYMKITESTEEETQKQYDDSIDTAMSAAGFGDIGVSEELSGKYRQMIVDMLKQAKYTVTEAKETEDGFDVTVEVEPFTALSGLEEEVGQLQQTLIDELTNAETIPSDEEINELLFQKLYELMAEKVANPTYGEKQSITVQVTEDSDKVYSIPDSDMQEIDAAMFPAN